MPEVTPAKHYAMIVIELSLWISSAHVLSGRPFTISVAQLCLESIFGGVWYFIVFQKPAGATWIMIGGCICWYLSSIVGDELFSLLSLIFFQMFPGVQKVTWIMAAAEVCAYHKNQPKFPLIFIMVAVLFNYAWQPSDSSFRRGWGDPIFLSLPFYQALTYLRFEDPTHCWIPTCLILGLGWIKTKEHQNNAIAAQQSL